MGDGQHYVPEGLKDKVPAVLAVHGHYPSARRDPVVQAHCLGLVKLGFFVLVVDAFGAGERHPTPGKAPIAALCSAHRYGRPAKRCWECRSTTIAEPWTIC